MSDAREVARWVYVHAQSWKGEGGHFADQDPTRGAGVHQHERVRVGELVSRIGAVAEAGGHTVTGPALFVELCAGLASVSLRLQGGPFCRPPVSRMGNKAGYAEAILHVLGLRAGQGAGAFLWCEPDDGCRALLQAYPQPDILREAAEIIRSWADEDPRELWERLRAEGPIRGAGGGEVARWVTLAHVQQAGASIRFLGGRWEKNGGASWGPVSCRWRKDGTKHVADGTEVSDTATRLEAIAASEIARWARIVTSNRLINVDPETWKNTGEGGTTHGGEAFATGAEELARGMEGVSGREVARFALVTGQSVEKRPTGASWFTRPNGEGQKSADGYAEDLERIGSSWPPVTVTDDGRKLFKVPEGAIVYIDPPYQGTTGYGADLGRDEVVTLARSWARRGAVVCISEAEPIPELVEDGWHNVEITRCRKGQKRTFSRQQREFLTLNRAPAWRPAEQQPLFGTETP